MSTVSNGHGFGSFLATFVVGAAAGAAIALLTTPRNGREMRAQLKDATREMKQSMQQIPGAVQTAGAKAVKAGQAVFAQAKGEVTEAYNKANEASKDRKGFGLEKDGPRFSN